MACLGQLEGGLHADRRIVGGLVARRPGRVRLARAPDARTLAADGVVLDLLAPGVPLPDDDDGVVVSWHEFLPVP